MNQPLGSESLERVSAADAERQFFGEAPSDRRWVFLMGLLSPGLAWAWRGFTGRGVLVNLAFVLMWFAFAMYWVVNKFYPVEPTLWFLVGWFGLLLLSAWDAARAPGRSAGPVTTFYLLAMLVCTWLVPLASVYAFARENIAEVVRVDSPAMFPTLIPGDRVLVDKHVYRISRPRPGDIVYYHSEGAPNPSFGRVLAIEGEIVSVVQRAIYVSGMSVVHSDVGGDYAGEFARRTGVLPSDVGALFEVNGSAVYWISEPRMGGDPSFESGDWFVRERQLFVLNDNRSVADDSRRAGPVMLDEVIGMPVYVLGNRSEHRAQIEHTREAVLQAPRTRALLVEEQRRYLEMFEQRK